MKRSLATLSIALFALSIFAQNDPRVARLKTPLSKVEQVILPTQNNPALLDAEMARRAAQPNAAPKFAEVIPVEISPETHGDWELTGNEKAVWRLRIFSNGAKSLNLGFTKYAMPAGGSLILYSPDFQQIQGPFQPSDNEAHEQLWTPVLPGEEVVLEVQLPQRAIPDLRLELKYVNHDFIGFPALLAQQQSTINNQQFSGSCNLDVACDAADGWAIVDNYRDIIQSVAVISIGGSLQCTGFLVNNARQDCTPYFMTANHCGLGAGNAATLIAYWNYQNGTCRQPNSPASGGNGDGVLNDFNTGSIFRSGWQDSDFTLVELDDPVSETAEAFYAGWNAENVAPADTVIVVHHPSSDEKRISFEFDPTYVSNQNGTASTSGNYLAVPDYDVGTTEPGSSGAPIFNREKQVVGQLWGGDALCGNDLYDSYGWFHRSWEGGGTPDTRLKNWLDPDATGIVELGGRSQLQCDLSVEGSPASLHICAPADAVFNVQVSENFTGSVFLSLENLPGALLATFAQNPVEPGGMTTLVISGTSNLPDSTFILQLFGTDSLLSNSSELALTIAQQPPVVELISPQNEAQGIAFKPIFSWKARPGETFDIQIATDDAFVNLVETATNLPAGTFQAGAELAELTQYFWRIRGTNACGQGDWSAVWRFKTGVVFCLNHASADVPMSISSSGTPVVVSTLFVPVGGFIADVNVSGIQITHSWVGDLRISLTSPSGTEVELMTNIQQGDCSGNNLELAFDDEAATQNQVLENTCNSTPPAASGLFQPLQFLAAFKGEPATGDWTLRVFDDADQDGGSLDAWGLEICGTVPHDFSVTPLVSEVAGCVGEAVTFDLALGGAFAESPGVTLTAGNLPPGATASFSPNPAVPGTIVSVTLSGATTPGIFTPQITATDGSATQTAEIQWEIFGVPDAPTPVSPAQNATGIAAAAANFSWTAVPSATLYQLELATDPGMANPIETIITPGTTAPVEGLEFCTDYFWRVFALNDCGQSAALEVFHFTTIGQSPSLILPANNAVNVPQKPFLDWSEAAGADSFLLEIATTASFANLVLDSVVTASQAELATPLGLQTAYFWRVTPLGNCGGSASQAFKFTTTMESATQEWQGTGVSVLPNPTSGLLLVQLSKSLGEAVELQVVSSAGVELKNERLTAGELSARLDLAGFPAGIYWLKLVGGEAVFTEKIMLK